MSDKDIVACWRCTESKGSGSYCFCQAPRRHEEQCALAAGAVGHSLGQVAAGSPAAERERQVDVFW
jgi:hypothetical protein